MTIFGDQIMTPRLCLRKIVENDISLIVEWSNSNVANGNYLSPEKLTEEKSKEEFKAGIHWNQTNRTFIVEHKEDSQPMGTIHYWLRAEQNDCAMMALKIAEPSLRNRGFGTEAQKYLIIHLFQQGKVQAVEMYTDINNEPQQRCLQKLGFTQVDSLQYEDNQKTRAGYLYRLKLDKYYQTPMYHFYYE